MAAVAVMMALFHHAKTGEGQEVEVPMFETMVSFNLVEHLAGAVFEPIEHPMGYARLLSPHRKPHRTVDGYIVLLPYTTRQWRAFFTLAGRGDMLDDARVNDPALRSREIASLYAMISDIMPARTTAEWLGLLRAADIPAAPVNKLEDLLHEPHLVATGFFETYDHPTEGRLRTTSVPVRFSRSPGRALRRPPPRLGADTREVLAEAGLDRDAIARLEEIGAAVSAP
jgi:crotonobetainyl-CoA:carnitine CoA-transferase CaiB-like acyl-CoA transferase